MQNNRFKQSLSFILCIVLIAAMALFAIGCTDNKTTNAPSNLSGVVSQDVGTVLGNGATKFTFSFVDASGVETTYEINTDKTIVGDALVEHNLISGEQGAYGLYVKTVGGITVDYDTDGKYWAFYVDGQYATEGVDTTNIEAGRKYTFKVE